MGKGCLHEKRLQIAKLVTEDGKNEDVQKLYQHEINTHENEGEAINCLMVN